MRALSLTAPTLRALLVGALLLGALGAEDCPDGCTCSRVQDLDMRCKLPRTYVSVKGEAGAHVQIICDPGGEDFSIEELPQLQYRPGAAIRLELQYCRLPPTFAQAASRIGASSLQALYIRSAPDGVELTADMVKGLDKLERLAIFADKTYTITIPREAFSHLPALHHFTINNAVVLLSAGDFATAPALTYLELSNCNITRLPDDIFNPLKNLEKLILFGNKLEELTPAQLRGLPSLQMLEVSTNGLRSLDAVSAVGSITQLHAFANRLEELPALNLTKLEKLQLTDNRVPLTIHPQALSSLPKLQSVDLSRCGITDLPADTFSESRALKTLKISGNKLQTLNARLFSHQSALEELDLRRNSIAELPSTVFQPLQALKRLYLDYNNITRLPAKLLSGLTSLRALTVSHNRLATLTADSLAGALELEQLDLSYNNISNPDPDSEQYLFLEAAFSQLGANLQSLDLSHNSLTVVPTDVQHSALFLKHMNVAYNRIQELYDMIFVSNSATVDFTHNDIRLVYLAPATSSSGGVNDQSERSVALLDDNPFLCDCKIYPFAQRLHGFRPHDTIEARIEANNARCATPPSLSGRLVRKIPLRDFTCDNIDNCPTNCQCKFRPYTKAVELTCEQPPDTYPNLVDFGDSRYELQLTERPSYLNITTEIRQLNLSGLGLKEMPSGPLPNNLKMLDLSRNNFASIPASLFEKDLILKLEYNPLLCDCWHEEDVVLLQKNRFMIEDFDRVKCKNDGLVSHVNVPQLCSTWRASIIGGVLAMLGLITATIALLILKYFFEIKVWLYARGMFARWHVIDDDERKYDAFISFCHKDEDFVSEYLLPGLENVPQPYKLCIHSRDWMPGQFITTHIAQSVADSRRTIIVVSKNFLKSQWARAEFRTANMSAIKERKTRVIAILLEDVSSHKELDPELKAYLSTNTYLKWGDPWFWDKLRYALPHRKVEGLRAKDRVKAKVRETVAMARAEEARKVVASGIDTRLTADGVIINAAALAVPNEKKYEHINLDICKLDKLKSMV